MEFESFNYGAVDSEALSLYLEASPVNERVNHVNEIRIYTGENIELLRQSRGDISNGE